jgi:hypothetical protein
MMSCYNLEALVMEPQKLTRTYFSEKSSVNNPRLLYAGQANVLWAWSYFPLAASLLDCYSGND